MIENKGNIRNVSADMLKTIAIIGVLLIHVSSSGLTHPIGSSDWFSALLYGCLARASVPLFLMCSGALMLDKDRQYPVRKILTHNLPHILVALFFGLLSINYIILLSIRL